MTHHTPSITDLFTQRQLRPIMDAGPLFINSAALLASRYHRCASIREGLAIIKEGRRLTMQALATKARFN